MPRSDPSGTGAYGTVAITTSAALIKAAKGQRRSLLILNAHATNILYIGTDASVTTATGFRLDPDDSVRLDDYAGDVWGIASAAATDVRFLQVG